MTFRPSKAWGSSNSFGSSKTIIPLEILLDQIKQQENTQHWPNLAPQTNQTHQAKQTHQVHKTHPISQTQKPRPYLISDPSKQLCPPDPPGPQSQPDPKHSHDPLGPPNQSDSQTTYLIFVNFGTNPNRPTRPYRPTRPIRPTVPTNPAKPARPTKVSLRYHENILDSCEYRGNILTTFRKHPKTSVNIVCHLKTSENI